MERLGIGVNPSNRNRSTGSTKDATEPCSRNSVSSTCWPLLNNAFNSLRWSLHWKLKREQHGHPHHCVGPCHHSSRGESQDGNHNTGSQLNSLSNLYNKQLLKKTESILSDSAHALHSEFQLLLSGSRFSYPPVNTNRYKDSFIPQAIALLNSNREREYQPDYSTNFGKLLLLGKLVFLNYCLLTYSINYMLSVYLSYFMVSVF